MHALSEEVNVFTGWAIIILGYHMNKIDAYLIMSHHGTIHPAEADYLSREDTETCHDGT